MDLLLRINREGGTTVIVATHDTGIVDRLRKRVIQLDGGRLVRDEARGGYTDTVAQEIGLPQGTSQFPSVSGHVPGTTGVFPAVNPNQTPEGH
jgi:cell division transport system ATP-binding protein